MRKVSDASTLSSALFFHRSLRAAIAAFSSARPKSTGPAETLSAQATRLINNRTPASPRQIHVDYGARHNSARQQSQAAPRLVQQKLARAKQDAINQHATRNPIDEVRETIARWRDV